MARLFKAADKLIQPVDLPNRRDDLVCPQCVGRLILKSVPSIERPFYGCENWPECRVTHGAHPDGRPMGKPADDETRAARHQAHQVFDALWLNARDRRTARKVVYVWLQEALGLSPDECHIGEFDLETCMKVQRVCRDADLDEVFSQERVERIAAQPKGGNGHGTGNVH